MPEQLPEARPNTDDGVIALMPDVLAVHRNATNWYNNASFLLPAAAAFAAVVVGFILHSVEIFGFAAFIGVVTLLMLPVVLSTWRQTATAVVLTRERITSLHRGRELKSIAWTSVRAISRRETQGNVRWEVAAADGERILLDGEVEDLPGLLSLAARLAGLPEPADEASA
jgi:hypothetical protein